ncbi:sigma-E factor negative regulatory protein [Trinickia fusca]|uniref:Anti-sigma factor n=1 Tax=Trinickia fusca TaxID=2419777 RepID=A0A494XVF2_9BURK|nr:sigma-E factor negative regulatory protein [Trinickia fusca]RKP52049.1 anti-sigma factor [Trinickia fusca]
MGSVSMQSQECSRGERLSAFLDGEWADEHVGDVLGELDRAERATWGEYHLIGDALRSDDLAVHPAMSDAFLKGFAARLEAEPHVLAPASVSRAGTHRLQMLRRRFMPALAIAAAAATLTWIVVPQVQRLDGAQGSVQTASAPTRADGVRAVAMNTAGEQANIIRDARLDQYLEAHQQFAQQPMMAGSMPLIRAAALTSQGQ